MKAQYPILLFLAFLLPFIGSSQKATHSYGLQKDILWASPEGFDLTMDIYTPEFDLDHYPVLVIFHGGGWLINDKSIMDSGKNEFLGIEFEKDAVPALERILVFLDGVFYGN
jgi:hypothetical protein